MSADQTGGSELEAYWSREQDRMSSRTEGLCEVAVLYTVCSRKSRMSLVRAWTAESGVWRKGAGLQVRYNQTSCVQL